jgi:hypothetical protein
MTLIVAAVILTSERSISAAAEAVNAEAADCISLREIYRISLGDESFIDAATGRRCRE